MATRTKSAKSKAVSKRKTKTTPTRKGKASSSHLPQPADGRTKTAEQIFAINDADDDSPDWRKWSDNKCERERQRYPEIDAWLAEGDACLDRLIAKYDDIHDAAKTLSPSYDRWSGYRWRHRALAVLKATGFPPKDFNNLNIFDELETLQAAAAMKAETKASADDEINDHAPPLEATPQTIFTMVIISRETLRLARKAAGVKRSSGERGPFTAKQLHRLACARVKICSVHPEERKRWEECLAYFGAPSLDKPIQANQRP